jgi:hypothetical protein
MGLSLATPYQSAVGQPKAEQITHDEWEPHPFYPFCILFSASFWPFPAIF